MAEKLILDDFIQTQQEQTMQHLDQAAKQLDSSGDALNRLNDAIGDLTLRMNVLLDSAYDLKIKHHKLKTAATELITTWVEDGAWASAFYEKLDKLAAVLKEIE